MQQHERARAGVVRMRALAHAHMHACTDKGVHAFARARQPPHALRQVAVSLLQHAASPSQACHAASAAAGLLTRLRATHSASCSERRTSSSTMRLPPRTCRCCGVTTLQGRGVNGRVKVQSDSIELRDARSCSLHPSISGTNAPPSAVRFKPPRARTQIVTAERLGQPSMTIDLSLVVP